MKRTIVGLRKDLGLTRQQYAEKLGIKPNTLIRYEQRKATPDVNVAIKIMKLSKLDSIEEVDW